MHLVFSNDRRAYKGIEAGSVDEYKLAGLLGMTVLEGPALPGPILKGHWRGFTVDIMDVPRNRIEPVQPGFLFPLPKEFLITFHLLKTTNVVIGIRHRALDAVGAFRPPLAGKRKCPMPPEFGREFQVRGPGAKAVKTIIDDEMKSLINRLTNFGAPELTIDYSLLKYRGPGEYMERYRELPVILGALVEIGRHLDNKLTIGIGE